MMVDAPSIRNNPLPALFAARDLGGIGGLGVPLDSHDPVGKLKRS